MCVPEITITADGANANMWRRDCEVVEVNFGFLWLVLVFSGPYLWGRRQSVLFGHKLVTSCRLL